MRYTFTLLTLFVTISASAQLKKGDWSISTSTNAPMNLKFSSNGSIRSWDFGINPSISYFVKDRWEIGAGPALSLRSSRYKDPFGGNAFKNTSTSTGVSLFTRYYLKKEGTLIPYLTVNGSYLRTNAVSNGPSGKYSYSLNEWQVGAGGGLSWFITPRTALFAELTYSGNWGSGNGYYSGLNFKIGFQFFLNKRNKKTK